MPGTEAPRWRFLITPKWLAWHLTMVVSVCGMLWLGDWQLHRAMSGNALSWAYTFEWPLFSAFTIYFWIKSLRDELRGHGAASSAEHDAAAPETTASAAARAVETGAAAATGRKPASWDATSWDAASWDATSQEAHAAGAGKPVEVARATPADGEAYRARLMAEVRGPSRRRGRP
jgi:hypothetical protein